MQNNVIDITKILGMKGVLRMPNDLITPENVSNELLRDLFESAYADFTVDEDGDIYLHEQVDVYLSISNNKYYIQAWSSYLFKEDAAESDKLAAVNNINANYAIVKSWVSNNVRIVFVHDFFIAGGITKKSLVLGIKRFASIPRDAVRDYAEDLVK